MNANFDTLKHTETFKSGGLDDAAAKAITQALDEALRESVATRADLRDTEARLTGRIDKFEGQLSGHMDKLEGHMESLESQLNGRMDRLEGQLNGRMDKLEGRLDSLESQLNGRMDRLEGQLNGRMDRLDGRMDKLEGQLLGLRGEVHVLMWSVSGMFAIVLAMLGWVVSAV